MDDISLSLQHSFSVIDAWGFKYVSNMVWNKTGNVGLGHYFRFKHEICLLGRRGSPVYSRKGPKRGSVSRPVIPSILDSPSRRHSQKPEEMYGIIEKFSKGPYLEMFARERRLGWDAWGDEVGGTV